MQHLDMRQVARGVKTLQPHCGTFHHTQALLAAAVGKYIVGMSFRFFLTIVLSFYNLKSGLVLLCNFFTGRKSMIVLF